MKLRAVTEPSRDQGFALVVVIGITTLLAVIAFIFTSSVRSHIQSAHADLASAEAEALSDAGVNVALLSLIRSRSVAGARRFPLDGSATACSLPGNNHITLRVQDEACKIDLNVAKAELLQALFVGLGLTPADASAHVDAISDFKDGDSDKRLNGAEQDEYLSAGLAAGPKNAPFEAIDELGRVIGFDAIIVRKIRPFVTVHSEQDGVDPAAISPELAELLNRGVRDGDEETLGFGDGPRVIPAQFRTASTKRFYAIRAAVQTTRGARFAREAVVSFIEPSIGARSQQALDGGAPAQGTQYRIWRWQRGESVTIEPVPTAAEVPPC